MKITTADKFWIVTDPTPVSVMADVMYKTDLAGLENIIIGGGWQRGNMLTERNMVIHTRHSDALQDAEARLAARA